MSIPDDGQGLAEENSVAGFSASGWLQVDRTNLDGHTVATVRLSRPDVRNAFDDTLIAELEATFNRLGREPGVRAIVLAADGSAFCAGADLNWMRLSVEFSFEDNVHDAQALSRMLKAIQCCPRPVIARVQGSAFGGGLGLLAACDMAVALESAKFCFSETKLGLIPAVISPFVLRKISVSAAQRYFLTAELFSAQEAYRLGLINELAKDEAQLDTTIENWLKALVANGPDAMAHCKALLSKLTAPDWQRAVDLTTKLIAERRASAEGQEGMRAFLEKRTPQWQTHGRPTRDKQGN